MRQVTTVCMALLLTSEVEWASCGRGNDRVRAGAVEERKEVVSRAEL